jgi:hypothetical protein
MSRRSQFLTTTPLTSVNYARQMITYEYFSYAGTNHMSVHCQGPELHPDEVQWLSSLCCQNVYSHRGQTLRHLCFVRVPPHNHSPWLRHIADFLLTAMSYCSYHGGSSKAILQWHFIILLCLAVISLVLVSTYGHSHKGVQPSKATRRNRSTGTIRVTKGVAPCTVTAREITCSDIVGNTGEFIADYINQNSGSVSTHERR